MRLFKKSIWFLTALMIAIPVFLYAAINWYQLQFEKLPIYGKEELNKNNVLTQHQIESFEFRNQDGMLFSSDSLKNKIIIANFFFTSCGNICPNMMQHMKKVQDDFLNDRNLAFISFTVDPVRDDAARLKWYSEKYNINKGNWDLLTGDKKEIYKLARKSFYLSADDGDGGENDFIHSDQLVLIDKNRHIRGYYKGTDDSSIKQLKQDIKKLEYEN